MNIRVCLGVSISVLILTLFGGFIITLIVAGGMTNFTCDQTNGTRAAWKDKCTAARVGDIAMYGLMCTLGLAIVAFMMFLAGFLMVVSGCCSCPSDYFRVSHHNMNDVL